MNGKSLLLRAFTAAMLLFCLSISADIFGQVTTSSINGFVTDASGEYLPGATVTAIHEPSGTTYGTVTTEAGKYTFPSVRIGGPYKITVTYVGFNEQSRTNIFAELGAAASANISLKEGGTQLEEVVVTSNAGQLFNGERTGAATSINTEQLRTLPTVTRSISDFTRLSPQSNGGNSFGGRDGRYNNFQVDGANFNNGFGLNDNPLPGGGGLSIDAIEEIQVNIAPFDVRQSGFSGAGINAVTRSGTNKFTGSAYGFFSNQDLQGKKVNGEDITRPDATSQTLGFRLGGPLVKNKLFFFVNAEHIKKTGSGVGAVNLWQASENGVADPGKNISRTKRADLEAVRNHLINQWGYDPGAYENYANDNSEKTTSFLARIDWNINAKNKLAVRYNQVESSAPSLVNANSGAYPRTPFETGRVSSLSMSFANTMYSTKNIVRSITAELNSEITPRLSNQFLATYSRIQATRSSPSSEFPMIDIGFAGDSLRKPGVTTYQNYISAGYELFTYGNDVLNDNFIVTNNLTYVVGKHNFTAGASFEMQKFGNRYLRNGTSYYRYASVEEFLATGTPNEEAPLQFALTYPYEGQDPYAPIKYGLPSVYIQDKFDISERFTLTAGIRAEMPVFLNDLTPNTTVDTLKLLGVGGAVRTYDTGSWPKTRVMLSPRVGFRWDVKGDNSLVFRGGTGIFAGRVPFVWLTNMPSNLGVIQNTVEPGSYAASAPWIGDIRFQPDKYYWLNNTPESAKDVFIKNPRAGLPSTLALVDQNFKMPQIWRTSFGADYKIPGTPFAITGDVIYTKDIQAVYQFGANRKAATQTMNYSGDNREFYPNTASYQYNSKIGANSVSVLTNTSKGHSINATIGLTMQARRGFYGSLYYSHTSAKTTTDNLGSNASSAWGATPNINNPNDLNLYSSEGALPHRLIGTVSYRIEYANHLASTVSLYYNGANQGRLSYTYNGDLNGDAIGADMLYIPKNASELNFVNSTVSGVTFSAEQQRDAFEAYIKGNSYLDKNRGKYAARNGDLMPWLNRFDFKFLQDIFTNIGNTKHTLQLSVDILNVGNLLNSDWGVRQEIISGANMPLRRASVTSDGVPNFTMNAVQVGGKTVLPDKVFRDVTTTSTTWSMLVGVRYLF
ncbi:carboxypeptidase-like regulatory domain-containing protein [Dyadobacter sp. CY261]|uniref:TonB-dependent receptor n=1 Tax=Dyadobacter sp. CY261 TaxID=2907203 RepID=UPI001F1F305C|nr:carboxypeptidase-like regulatory domain-containing protein [Dyadobacter sp. CY261]MCF0073132.1 carboxypeptidase-like regulatory domain-containing protein [Dyadobacter sp. CY261]